MGFISTVGIIKGHRINTRFLTNCLNFIDLLIPVMIIGLRVKGGIMKPLLVIILTGVSFCGLCYLSWKFWDWLCKDPRDPHQDIPDEQFRQAKAQDRLLSNGFVDNEER